MYINITGVLPIRLTTTNTVMMILYQNGRIKKKKLFIYQ